jgi:NAD(P)-dependent dehydrogenase (short-subunit alcohol dehydrogenase family)
MRVLVTGGTGRIGAVVVRWLDERGYSVRVVDTSAQAETPPGVELAACDINDYPTLREQVRGCDAVVHLAALASPASGSADVVFRVNAAGSFNVYRAAEEEGIRRVVQASSINAVGLYYGLRRAEPLYLPIDEHHPPQDTDVYSFSKWVVEEIADYHWRRSGISGVSLRFPAVSRYEPSPRSVQYREQARQLIERVAAMPEEQRSGWLERSLAEIDELRARGMFENREFWGRVYRGEQDGITPEQRWLLSAPSNLWTAIDERDAAQAVEKALSADYSGSHPLFVCDRNNTTGFDSELLARLFFPRVTARKRPLQGRESLVSIEKSRQLIGFDPQFTLA